MNLTIYGCQIIFGLILLTYGVIGFYLESKYEVDFVNDKYNKLEKKYYLLKTYNLHKDKLIGAIK